MLSLFDKEAIRRIEPHQLISQLKQIRLEQKDLDIIFVEEEAFQGNPRLISSIRSTIDNTGTLIVVLVSSLNKALAEYVEEYRNVVTLKKPLLWTRFFNELLTKWYEFLEPPLHVLVVEDDAVCQRSQQIVLESLGCKVTVVNSGEEALSLVEQIDRDETVEMFDVIIMDIGLPGIEGTQAAQELKTRYGDKCPPLVAHTGYTRKIDLDKLQELNVFEDFLEKPASLEMFQDTLEQLRNFSHA